MNKTAIRKNLLFLLLYICSPLVSHPSADLDYKHAKNDLSLKLCKIKYDPWKAYGTELKMRCRIEESISIYEELICFRYSNNDSVWNANKLYEQSEKIMQSLKKYQKLHQRFFLIRWFLSIYYFFKNKTLLSDTTKYMNSSKIYIQNNKLPIIDTGGYLKLNQEKLRILCEIIFEHQDKINNIGIIQKSKYADQIIAMKYKMCECRQNNQEFDYDDYKLYFNYEIADYLLFFIDDQNYIHACNEAFSVKLKIEQKNEDVYLFSEVTSLTEELTSMLNLINNYFPSIAKFIEELALNPFIIFQLIQSYTFSSIVEFALNNIVQIVETLFTGVSFVAIVQYIKTSIAGITPLFKNNSIELLHNIMALIQSYNGGNAMEVPGRLNLEFVKDTILKGENFLVETLANPKLLPAGSFITSNKKTLHSLCINIRVAMKCIHNNIRLLYSQKANENNAAFTQLKKYIDQIKRKDINAVYCKAEKHDIKELSRVLENWKNHPNLTLKEKEEASKDLLEKLAKEYKTQNTTNHANSKQIQRRYSYFMMYYHLKTELYCNEKHYKDMYEKHKGNKNTNDIITKLLVTYDYLLRIQNQENSRVIEDIYNAVVVDPCKL